MSLKETFQRQGGMNLIKQYARSGSLGTAINQFLVLGRSRTALEILRLSTQMKIKQKLEKKYRAALETFDRNYDESLPHESSSKVWICWFQGMNNAPEIVQKCYESVKECFYDRDIVLLTSENIYQFVEFPNLIQQKIDRGIIKGAHLSDLLRLELLIKYGGTWIDATVLCTSKNIPKYMKDSELFAFQCMKPGRDGHCSVISNWFITSRTNNRILSATQYLLYNYWEKKDKLVDYFIFHDFFQVVIERYPDEWLKVIPFSNSTPHILLLRLFDEYDEQIWNSIKEQSPLHKLTYKVGSIKKEMNGTYYQKIIKDMAEDVKDAI